MPRFWRASGFQSFNDVHLTEKLRETHGLPVSRASVRRIRLALGVPAQRPRRAPPHRSRRPRADAVGRLVQLDGSPCAWLEERGAQGGLVQFHTIPAFGEGQSHLFLYSESQVVVRTLSGGTWLRRSFTLPGLIPEEAADVN